MSPLLPTVLWSRARAWLRALTTRSRLEHRIDEELHFHLDARTADLIRQGLDPLSARRTASLEFGTVATHKDSIRRSLGLKWPDELWADLRYAARILRKNPAFTTIAVLSLALAIGANTTIFSLANELLYARLGVPHPEQLRLLTTTTDRNSGGRSDWGSDYSLPNGLMWHDTFTYPIYRQLQRENRSLGEIFAYKESLTANATVAGEAQAVRLELVSGNLYQQLQVRPILGRAILPADDGEPGTGAVTVLSYGFWQHAFGGSPAAIGAVIRVNGTPVTIVGVNPPGFTGVQSVQSSPELFLPLSMMPLLRSQISAMPFLSSPELWWVQLMARARPGVSTAQAQAALNTQLAAAVRGTITVGRNETIPQLHVEDGSRGLNSSAREFAQPIFVLLTLTGFVLLLACANIANLMLARAAVRQREMGVRLALGAGRARVLRQVLTESLLLSALGGALGLVLGYLGRSAMPKLLYSSWQQADLNIPFDWRVFTLTAGVTLATGILFGLAPAWAATRAEIGTALKDGGKTATRQRRQWSGRAIVAVQIALSTLLVFGACLFLRTLYLLNTIDPGFPTDHLVLVDINPSSQTYPAPKDAALHARIEETLRTIPGVDGVTLSDIPLLADSQSNSGFYVEGAPELRREFERGSANLSLEAAVGRDFFSVLHIPLIAGRAFSQYDMNAPQRVAIINQSLAARYFPNQNPVGKRFSMEGRDAKQRTWLTVVGVCADIRFAHLREDPPPMHFDLYRQAPEVGGVTYILRSALTPAVLAPSLRAAVRRVDPDLPLMDIRTEREQIDATMQQERTLATLTVGFGILALALACVGIYGIMAYTVSQRTNEIGIRLALGADRRQVRGMVLRETGWLATAGIVAGLAAALLLARLVRSMLYGLEPTDPTSLLATACLLIAVALLAGWVPAARASRVEPMAALRHE